MDRPSHRQSETAGGDSSALDTARRIILFLCFLYLFLLSIQLMGVSFELFGSGFAEQLLRTTAHPLKALFIGLLATSLTQSSSTTTSITVGLVAGGALDLHHAIPIILGANVGTTVTNTMVSLGHIRSRHDFRRAFAASVVLDVFNVLSVIIILPLQQMTGYLEYASNGLAGLLGGAGGVEFSSPLKVITEPAALWLTGLMGGHALLVLAVAIVFLFAALRHMVRFMKSLVMERAEVVFEKTIFRTPFHGLAFGMILTSVVQSSSVTTSLIVPLAGTGLIGLDKVFPYTLGANLGTTVTALLASLATGSPAALAVAFSHMLFNVSGILIFWWIPRVPITIAQRLAGLTMKYRAWAAAYIVAVFFIIPALAVYLL